MPKKPTPATIKLRGEFVLPEGANLSALMEKITAFAAAMRETCTTATVKVAVSRGEHAV
jgi:hypothetical protein